MRLKFKDIIKKATDFIRDEMWELNLENLSRTKANLVRTLQVVYDTIVNLDKNNLGMLSASLCYFCMMSIVPFIAVCFALTDGLGLSDMLSQLLYTNFGTDNQFVNMVLTAANNIINTAKSGGVGLISALMFVWLVIWMMDRVEKVFNMAWGIPKPKKNRNRYFAYGIDLAILIFAPFVIILFFSGSIVYYNILDWIFPNNLFVSETLKTFLGWIIFGATIILIVSAMYKFIPAIKVRYKFAFKAAVIAGLSFTVLQYLYLETQLLVTRIDAVYGAIAAIPLMLLWLRFGWLIIVMGVQLTCTFQKLSE